ncbi:putative hydroxymethylpyrimidine transporter CytX [bacterium]|uniref:putative hydroxymethylpyrimidine transporter CytX n=1 Tax=Gemmiger sp. TaxID=2049027 RepID=UPI002A83342B|nr:putative hydroxymethylpyrimidine transporter CytX [Gemmiger sp.]MCI5556579.1 putative hydroxymethylpyrimidine transporter CytX [bacterium]MCI6083345.1 putative hydroxymethylpyrimidine transporter CytX [bacterium]MCI6249150.1 putative hydroxymethylpyrimidine transporter CytX [bacterium]MCI6885130.1 putative hydroxymethylpyrimidine transporter CytX [bacterium]MCI7744608.1 putative hydroxymethylpyrimidine transporter CytX [bacterium]
MNKKTSTFSNALIWFGAGVSIAEILTGTYFAPLGMAKGFAAIVIGHGIGCAMMFLAGLIGGRTGRSAMETVKMSFGRKGSLLFSVLNVLQLVGWTAIMIYDGALAANGIAGVGAWVWCLVIGALILVWIAVGITDLGRINQIVMALLFLLTLVLCKVIFFGGNGVMTAPDDSLSFGAAVELAVAMPLSWLPLISDYTREAEKPFAATLASTLTYGAVSCWMYLIGMGAAIYTGQSDIALIMVQAGLGVAALVILVLSTVTTTFLDAWSAGISSESIFAGLKGRQVAMAVTVIGTVGAIVFPMDDITDFLYLIGSVFAPMIAVQIADYFLLKTDVSGKEVSVSRLVLWFLGFLAYRVLMGVDLPLGSTLPDMVITMLLTLGWALVFEKKRLKKA